MYCLTELAALSQAATVEELAFAPRIDPLAAGLVTRGSTLTNRAVKHVPINLTHKVRQSLTARITSHLIL